MLTKVLPYNDGIAAANRVLVHCQMAPVWGKRLAEAGTLYRVMVELDVGYCSAVSLAVGGQK